MAAWLTVQAALVPSQVAVDAARYERTAFEMAGQVEDAVGAAFSGAVCLRRRFAARSLVDIKLSVSAVDRLPVGPPRATGPDGLRVDPVAAGGRGGPAEISCRA